MIFLFGSRSSKIDAFNLSNCACPNCQSIGTLNAFTFSKYFHIFFIPFMPIGTKTVAECSHCLKTYDGEKSGEKIKTAIENHSKISGKKRPIWHGCGCLVILLLIVIFFISTCAGLIMAASSEDDEPNPSEIEYKKDFAKLTSNPQFSKDSTGFYLKNCLDLNLSIELDKEKYKYFTRVEENKALILLEVSDMKKVKSEERKQLIGIIKDCLSGLDYMDNKELYIGVEGKWNPILVATPNANDLDGKFADITLLYKFYMNENFDKKTDTINK